MGRLTFEVLDSVQGVAGLETVWRRLHKDSGYASVYNGFDFVFASIKAFSEPGISLYFLVARDADEVVAIFPMQLAVRRYRGARLRVVEYAAMWEIDKPYPVIRRGSEDLAWRELGEFLIANRAKWHRIDLMEIREGLPGADILRGMFGRPRYLVNIREDRGSPIVDLRSPWEDRWSAHRKMRKKVTKMQSTFGDRLRFEVVDGADNWASCLEIYTNIEAKGWKAGRVGIGKNAATLAFYRDFFPRLSALGGLSFGILYVDDTPVSAEIAYVHDGVVYFSHGTFDEEFAKYSPGMVSTCLFLKHFHDSGLKEGDYLAGYAGYMIPWADRIVPSAHLVVHRLSLMELYVMSIRLLGRVFFRRRPNIADGFVVKS